MTFREWAHGYAEEMVPGCGRYKDMEAAYRAGQEEMRESAVKARPPRHGGPGTAAMSEATERARKILGQAVLYDVVSLGLKMADYIETSYDAGIDRYERDIKRLPLEGDGAGGGLHAVTGARNS